MITSPAEFELQRIRVHDRVRVPDGRYGIVKGFFRCNEEAMLVRFDRGGCERISAAGVARIDTPHGTPFSTETRPFLPLRNGAS
jgi:hypothetical protein